MHDTPHPFPAFAKAVTLAAILFAAPLALAQQPATQVPTPQQLLDAIRAQLPAPPEGFAWTIFRNAVFLKPAGWFEQTALDKPGGIPMHTFAASPEDFSATKPFETGVTVQIISGGRKLRGIDAKKMAAMYLAPFVQGRKPQDALMFEQGKRGDFDTIFFRYRDAPPGLTPVIIHKFILANVPADTVHVFTFEAPEANWTQAWASFGTPIISKVNVLPNVPAE